MAKIKGDCCFMGSQCKRYKIGTRKMQGETEVSTRTKRSKFCDTALPVSSTLRKGKRSKEEIRYKRQFKGRKRTWQKILPSLKRPNMLYLAFSQVHFSFPSTGLSRHVSPSFFNNTWSRLLNSFLIITRATLGILFRACSSSCALL